MSFDDLDVNKRIFDTGPGSSGTEAFESLFMSDDETVFQKAVVVEVITDPAAFRNRLDFDKKYSRSTISNFQFMGRVSRNCILARPLNQGQGKRTQKFEIVLPFFPSHLCFPVKPGEHVWIIKPVRNNSPTDYFHWMCRVPSWDDTEDANYSHEARSHHYQSGEESAPDPAEEATDEPPKKEENATSYEMFGFPNGTGDSRGFTFGNKEVEYCIYSTGSFAYHSFKYEPVPRLTKRPGDFMIQGSNNTSITLGQTKNYIPGGYAAAAADQQRIDALSLGSPPKKSISTIPSPESFSSDPAIDPSAAIAAANTAKEPLAPAIDIVAGRGYRVRAGGIQHLDTDQEKLPLDAPGPLSHAPTYPRVKKTVTNSDHPRGDNLSEASKNPASFMPDLEDSLVDHAIEGDPDLRYDAARIYVAADGEPDVDFGLATGDSIAIREGSTIPSKTGANIVLKSDNVRIIARKDPDDVSSPTSGAIRIIKEGAPGPAAGNTDASGQKAVISLEEDGTIYIEGPKIVIGGRAAPAATRPSSTADQIFLGGYPEEGAVVNSAILGEALCAALVSFSVDLANVLHGVGGLEPNVWSTFEHGLDISMSDNTLAESAAKGNMGTPLLCPGYGAILTKFHSNLEKCLSRTTKVK